MSIETLPRWHQSTRKVKPEKAATFAVVISNRGIGKHWELLDRLTRTRKASGNAATEKLARAAANESKQRLISEEMKAKQQS